MKAWEFYKSLHGRGESLGKLAVVLQTTASHLSQVVNGSRGKHTRKHIARFLTARETEILGWQERGTVPEAAELTEAEADAAVNGIVLQGTSSHLETDPEFFSRNSGTQE